MANRTETATLIMALRDELSGNAGKVATALDKVKGAETALAKESDLLNTAAKRLGEFGRLDERLASLNAKLSAERGEMRELGAAILAADKPSKQMEARYRALEKSAGVLTDQIGKQRAAVDEARAAFEKVGGPLDSMASAEERLRMRVGETTEAIRRQMRVSVEARGAEEQALRRRTELLEAQKHTIGEMKGMLSELGAASGFMGGAFATFNIAEHMARAGAVLATEQQRFKDAGPTAEAHLPEAMKVSQEVANTVPGTTQAENLRVINETRTAFGGVEEAIKNLKRVQTISQAVKIATGGKVEVPAEELGQAFSKILEMRGAAMDDAEFQRQGDAMVRAIIGTSGRLTPQKYLAFAQGAGRGTVSNLSTRFLTEAAPTLIGDTNSPETVGTALKGLRQIFMGHLSSKTQGEEWAKLIPNFDRTKLHLKGTTPGWEVGAIPDQKLAMTDPDKWIERYILGIGEDGERLKDSAAARAGIDIHDQLQVSTLLGRLAPKVGGGNSMLEALAQEKSRDQLAADAPQYREAHGAEQIVSDHAVSDAAQAVKNVNTSVEDLFSTLTGPMMPGIAKGLDALTGAVRRLNEASEESPAVRVAADLGLGAAGVTATGLSAIAGKYAWSRMFGRGAAEAASASALDGSAAALQGSAASIDAAASRLGLSGAATAAETASSTGLGLASKLAVGVPLVGAGLFVADAMINRRDSSKALVDGGRPDALTVNDNNLMLPGFATGGYTGDGGVDDVAGVVHGRELVLHADATSRFRRVAEAMNAGSARSIDLAGTLSGDLGANDSSSHAKLVEAVGEGVFRGFDRILETHEGAFGGGGAGGLGSGTVGTPMEGGGMMRAGSGPNMRYGRQHIPGGSNGLGRFDGNAPGANGYGLTNAPYTAPLDAKGEGGHLSPRELFSYFKTHGATDNEATMLTGAAGSESSFNPNAVHDIHGKNGPGHGLWGHNDHRINMTGLSWQQQADRALAEVKRDYADRVNAARTPEELADAEMHYERPRGYHGNNPRGGDNYTGRLNTLRRFSHGFGTMGFDPAKPETAQSGPESTGTVSAGSDGIAGHVRGTLKIGDESFAYGSGGVRGSAHIPYGDYPINPDAPGAWGRAHNAMAVNNDGSIWDASLGRMRTGIEMHVAHSANMVTEGCMSFLKDQYPTLKQRVREMVARTGHAYLHVGPGGASITPEAKREAEQAVLPKRAPAGASATPERHAAGVDFDHSSLREGIDHLRTFKAELAGLKGGVRVAIDHTHTHKNELAAVGRPGQLRTLLNGGYASDGRSWT